MMTLSRCLTVVFAAAAFGVWLPAPSQADDATCITALNKNAGKVATERNKVIRTCIKEKDKLGDPQAEKCSLVDAKGKVADARQKAVDQDVGGAKDMCANTTPSFLYTGATNANIVASAEALGLAHDIFGEDLDTSVVTDGNKAKMKCRDGMYKATMKLLDTKLKVFGACKKDAMKNGAASNAEIETACFVPGGPGLTDPKGKVPKGHAKLVDAASKNCIVPAQDTDVLFPGGCVGETGTPAFANCIDRLVECRTCRLINAMDGLGVDCDLFDDGLANGSCVVAPFKRAFVTSTTYDGALLGTSGADDKCQARADAALLGESWRAWLSENGIDALDRITNAEYRLVDGTTIVAANAADLVNCSNPACLVSPISKDEFGVATDQEVWTGTGSGGTGTADTCNSWWYGGTVSGTYGRSTQTGAAWTAEGTAVCNERYSLYCLER
jgi:hypothetical protein